MVKNDLAYDFYTNIDHFPMNIVAIVGIYIKLLLSGSGVFGSILQ